MRIRNLLGFVLFAALFATSSAYAHTIQIKACVNPDGSVTFYAGAYYHPSHAAPPSGGIVVDGSSTYYFTGYIAAGDLPACATYGDAAPCYTSGGPVDIWQVVTVPGLAAAGGTYSIRTTCTNILECDACAPRTMTFPAVVCGNNNNKVIICHQTSSGMQTLCVSPSSLPDHYGHGDYLGACPSPKLSADGAVTEFYVSQNYPNPFNPTTMIEYGVPFDSFVSLRVFNEAGEEVATLVEGFKSHGRYSVAFDANNLPSGTYFYRLQSGQYLKTNSMTVAK